MDKSIESFESLLPAFVTCSQKLRLGSTTHLEISEAHLRSVSHYLGLRQILPPPSTNAAIPQVRVEEKIKSLGFCSDISHFLPLILTWKISSITRVPIFNGLARKQPQLRFGLSQNQNSCEAHRWPGCCVEACSQELRLRKSDKISVSVEVTFQVEENFSVKNGRELFF